MLLVSFHGGKPEKNPHKNNVHAYDKDGTRLTSTVLQRSGEITLDELRAIYLVGKLLYVVNANKNENSVLCYSGKNTDYKFVGKFVSHAECPAIVHPFDLAFDGAGHVYVASQDTNVVTRLNISRGGKAATPAPLAKALPAGDKFLPGTFVASSVSLDPPTTPVAMPQGLSYSAPVGDKKHSVRGIEWVGGALYVADQPSHRVKVYGKNGEFLGQSNEVESPVHLIARKGTLFVSGGNQIVSAKLPKKPGDFELVPVRQLKVKNSSGMAFTPKGKLFVASRTENCIYKFDADFKPVKFACELPDNPEFLLHVPS
jgi:DNA-binding beta-propeller fold protein YncE